MANGPILFLLSVPFSFYSIKKQGSDSKFTLFLFHLETGFEINHLIKWDRRTSLKGVKLRITSLPDVPFIMPFNQGQIENPFNDGIYIDIFKVIQVCFLLQRSQINCLHIVAPFFY